MDEIKSMLASETKKVFLFTAFAVYYIDSVKIKQQIVFALSITRIHTFES